MLAPAGLRYRDSSDPDRSSRTNNIGDVLIRSTRVPMPGRRSGLVPEPKLVPGLITAPGSETGSRMRLDLVPAVKPGPGPESGPEPGRGLEPGTVQITVQKLPDPPGQRSPLKLKMDAPPPEEAEAEAGGDVVTSRFLVGGRGIFLEALKQRPQNAPSRREVRVQLLPPENPPRSSLTSKPEVGHQEAGPSSGYQGSTLKQSQVEAQISQLMEDVQKLLQADRGRTLSQQTHLETLQSQLLDSALKVLSRQAPNPSDSTALEPPPRLQVAPQRNAGGVQQVISTATQTSSAAVMETTPVVMETHQGDQRPEQTRKDRQLNTISTNPPPSYSQEAAKTANEVLREMRRLWKEMKMLVVRPEDHREAINSASDLHQFQQDRSQPHPFKSQKSQVPQDQSQQNQSKPPIYRSQQSQSKALIYRSQQSQFGQDQFQQNQPQPQPCNSQQNQVNQNQSLQNQSKIPVYKSKQSQVGQDQSQKSQSQPQPCRSQQNQINQDQSQQNQSQPHPCRSQQNPINQDQSQQNQSQPQPCRSQQNQINQDHSQQNQSQQQPYRFQQYQPQAEPSGSQPNLVQVNQSKQNQGQLHSHQDQFSDGQIQLNHFQESHYQHNRSYYQESQSQSKQSQANPQQINSHQNQSQQTRSKQSRRGTETLSVLEKASQVLCQVHRQKKLLEENLEYVQRSRAAESLHYQLEVLSANREHSEEVRIKKTVDAWINLQIDFPPTHQTETLQEDVVTSQQQSIQSSTHTGKSKPLGKLNRPRPATRGGVKGRQPPQRAEPDRVAARPMKSEQEEGEAYLTQLYGQPPLEGLRRTMKKSPYLRLSSPAKSPSRISRPCLVESVKGVKVKSSKAQTTLAPPLPVGPSLAVGPPFAVGPPLAVGPSLNWASHIAVAPPTSLTSVDPVNIHQPVAMAIPLGLPRRDSSTRYPRPQAPPTYSSDIVAVDNRAPDRQLDAEKAPPSFVPSQTVEIIERKEEEEEDEEECNVFPGTDFLSVADVIQEELSVEVEEAVEIDGGPSPPPVQYQGPDFPPQAPPSLPPQNQGPNVDIEQQPDALENRLVEWVEQQLMSKMISEMYHPPPPDPAQNDHTNQSDLEEQSVTSDIVEAAGGAGLQLFVDLNRSVDSGLIRQLVNEVLTETLNRMLSPREESEPPEPEPPGPGAQEQNKMIPLVPTPVPTPPTSPAPPREDTTIATPPPSEPLTPLKEELVQETTEQERIATPAPTPEPAPSIESIENQAPPPFTCEDAELPLDEEIPEQHRDTDAQPQLVSGVEDESPPSPPPPPSLPPSIPPAPPTPPPKPPSPSVSSSSSSSSSCSCDAATEETEAALKHISEGELIIKVNQQLLVTGGEEAGGCSFSSSLQEFQDMDMDPPSEGQVGGQELLLMSRRREHPQLEGSWWREAEEEEEEEISVGEVRDDQKAKLHRASSPSSPPQQTSWAAEFNLEGDHQIGVTAGNQSPEPIERQAYDLHTDQPTTAPQKEVRQTTAGQMLFGGDKLTAPQQEEEGTGRMDVHLPSMEEEEEVEEEVLSAAGADSSSSDVF